MWPVTPHTALPKPNGTVIKNDRNLFLAMKQAEGLTCHHRSRTFSHLNPQSPRKNFFAKIQSISSKLNVRRAPRGCNSEEGYSRSWKKSMGYTRGERLYQSAFSLVHVSLSLGSWRYIAISFRWKI